MGSRALCVVISLSFMATEIITNSTSQSQFEIIEMHVVTDYALCACRITSNSRVVQAANQKLLAFQY